MHEYDENISNPCFVYEAILLSFGFDATTKTGAGANRAPLVITEWGHDETDASDAYQSAYSTCLTNFMVQRQLGWMLWVLAGSCMIPRDFSFHSRGTSKLGDTPSLPRREALSCRS